MHGIDSYAPICYQDLFVIDDGNYHKVDICDGDAIDIIYTDIVEDKVAELLAQVPPI